MTQQQLIVLEIIINDKVMPCDRGEAYADPLAALLEEKQYGEIMEEGTFLKDNGEIESVRLELDLIDDEDAINQVIGFLQYLGAPKGSHFTIGEDSYAFGLKEGLALYLDGVNLPPETYQTTDASHVNEEVYRLTGIERTIDRFWDGPEETALYFYGDSFEQMQTQIKDLLDSYPLCKNARVVQIA